jgi:hypothetical protein
MKKISRHGYGIRKEVSVFFVEIFVPDFTIAASRPNLA